MGPDNDELTKEQEEHRGLALRNDLAELEIIQKKIDVLRDAGFSNDEIKNIVHNVIVKPLELLDKHIDDDRITDVELSENKKLANV